MQHHPPFQMSSIKVFYVVIVLFIIQSAIEKSGHNSVNWYLTRKYVTLLDYFIHVTFYEIGFTSQPTQI